MSELFDKEVNAQKEFNSFHGGLFRAFTNFRAVLRVNHSWPMSDWLAYGLLLLGLTTQIVSFN